jgi:hypothetical protein
LWQAVDHNENLPPADLHPEQCYILHEKSPFTGVSISIVQMKGRTQAGIKIKYHWLFISNTWEDAEPNSPDTHEVLIDNNKLVAKKSESTFAHFYNFSLITHSGGRRTRTRSRSRKGRKQKTRHNRRSKRA